MAGDGDRVLALVAEIRALDAPPRYLADTGHFYESWAHLFRGDREASSAAAHRNESSLRGGALEYFTDWALARVATDPSEALARYARAAEQPARHGSTFIVMALAREIGHLELVTGRPRRALEMLMPLCEQWYAAGDNTNWASTLCILTPTFAALGEVPMAAMLLGAIEESRTYALPMAGMRPTELDDVAERCLADLGDVAFERGHRAGRSATAKELMAHLRSTTNDLLAAPSAP